MKKAVLIAFVVGLIVVNLLAWLIEMNSEMRIGWAIRIPLILGITLVATIFSSATNLVSRASKEKSE